MDPHIKFLTERVRRLESENLERKYETQTLAATCALWDRRYGHRHFDVRAIIEWDQISRLK